MATQCMHLDQIKVTETGKHVCEDCIKTGDTWVHLRMCLICGHVGCCDSSKNKHATKHFQATEHPCGPRFCRHGGRGACRPDRPAGLGFRRRHRFYSPWKPYRVHQSPGCSDYSPAQNLWAEEAAAVGVPFLTAWSALDLARLEAGEWVIVSGAAGAVGSALIEVAHARGARRRIREG